MFDLDAAQITAADTMYFDKDSEKHMRELLSGAIGEGEDDDEGGHADMEHVEGLGEGVTLMPHQIRGVRWLKKREAARNYGGILADVSAINSSTTSRTGANFSGHGSGKDGADDCENMRKKAECE